MREYPIGIPQAALADFCRRHDIRSLALFGSVLRSDFGPHSDVDILVEFAPQARRDLWDHYFMREELQRLLGREVDIVNRNALQDSHNWIRKRAIIENAETIYVAG
ncbi:MAG: nucleotidyltransferase domain-containing protein [Phycisphaerales bacterium]|nr:MAG: nucleotidyltransferase domain-containing protein [Phycisphaerales bacterium]